MPAVAEPLLMTVEQYRQLPERDDIFQGLGSPLFAERGTTTITNRQGVSLVYGREDRIPLSVFDGDLAVSEIFSRA